MTEDLAEIEKLASAMLARVSAGDRRKLLRRISREVLQAGNRERIRRQVDPDGQPFAPRRKKQAAKPGNYAVKFLYPKGAAEPRLVFMKSWVRQGPLMTGYDQEAGGLRSFYWDKVAKFLPVPAEEDNASGGKLRARKGSIRRGAMFRKLANRFLKAGSTENEAWAGFDGSAAGIAEIHQDGLLDRPSKKAKPVRYAQRRLIGFTGEDRTRVLNLLLEHLGGSV